MFQIKIFRGLHYPFSKQNSPLYPPSESSGTTKTTYNVANSLRGHIQTILEIVNVIMTLGGGGGGGGGGGSRTMMLIRSALFRIS